MFFDALTDGTYIQKLVRTAMPNTISHEAVHWMKRNAPEQYQALEDMVFAALKNASDYESRESQSDSSQEELQGNSFRFDAAIMKEFAKYKDKHGRDIDDAEAREEIVARACEDLFGRSEAIKQFLADFAAQNKEAATGFTAAVKRVLAKIKAFFEDILFGSFSRTVEAGIVRKCGVDVTKSLQEQYEKTFFAALEGNAARNATGEFEQDGERFAKGLARINPENMQVKDAAELKSDPENDTHAPAFSEGAILTALWDAMDHKDAGDDNLILVSQMPRYVTEMLGIEGNFYIYRDHSYENMVSEDRAIADGRPTVRGGKKIHFHDIGDENMTKALLAIEEPIMTIKVPSKDGNPAVVMMLNEHGENGLPLYAVLSFYSKNPINGRQEKRPHIVATISPRELTEQGNARDRNSKGRQGWVEFINEAIREKRVLDYNKKRGNVPTVIAQRTRLGNITEASLKDSIARFRKEINDFKQKNKIFYSDPEDDVKSDREILASLLMEAAVNPVERDALAEYQKRARRLDKLNARLHEVESDIKAMMFARGKRDDAYRERLDALQREKERISRDIDRWDRKLLTLELTTSLQELLDREKKRTAKLWIEAGRNAIGNYCEKQLCRIYSEKIEEKAKNLGKMLLENSEKYHVPDAFKKPVAAFLSLLDFSSERALRGGDSTQKDALLQASFAEVVTLLQSLTDENSDEYLAGLDLPPDAVDEFVALSKEVTQMAIESSENGTMVLRRMSAEQLKALNTTLYAMTRAVGQANKLFVNERYQHVSELALDFIDSSEQYAARAQRSKLSDFLSFENMVPYYAFKRFGAAGEALFKGFMQGQDKFAFLVKEIIDFTDKLYTEDEVKEWSRQVHTFEGTNGKVYITTAQIMSLYELWKDADARKHILGGGGRIQDISFGAKKKYTNDPNGTALGELVVDAMFAKLTPRQKEVADKLQKFMAGECAKWGNEISYKRWGIRIFGLDYYFPIESDKNTLKADVEQRAKEAELFSLLHKSFTKKRVLNANNRIMIRSVFDVFASHATDMAKYNAFALPLLDMQKFINFKEIVTKEQAAAEAYQEAIENWNGEDKGGYFALGDTSDALAKIGVPQSKIYFDQSKAQKSMVDHPEVTKDVLKGIPKLLQNPIAVAESYDNTVLIYGELYDAEGHPVMVALRMDCNSRANDGTTVNKIRSVGVRMRSIDKYLAEQNILYLNEDKKRTDAWFQALGRFTPFGGNKYGSIKSISRFGQNVNTAGGFNAKKLVDGEQNDTSFTTKEVRTSMEKAFGTAAYKYIEQFLIDLNGDIGGRSAAEGILQKGITAHKIAAVGANLQLRGSVLGTF